MNLLLALFIALSPTMAVASMPTTDDLQEVKCWVIPIVGERICV